MINDSGNALDLVSGRKVKMLLSDQPLILINLLRIVSIHQLAEQMIIISHISGDILKE